MEISSRTRKRTAGHGWLTTLLGVLVLVAGGFAFGLVVGIVSEEPELVVGHVAGRSTEVDWSTNGVEAARPDAAPSPRLAEARPGAAPPERPARPAPSEREREPATAARALPPVAAPPPRAPAASATSGGYAIQVGAFAASKAAEQVAARLRKGGYRVNVVPPADDDRWRVRVGPMATKAEADRTARRLKTEESLPTWVLREQGT